MYWYERVLFCVLKMNFTMVYNKLILNKFIKKIEKIYKEIV